MRTKNSLGIMESKLIIWSYAMIAERSSRKKNMTTNIYVIDDSLNNDKPNTVVVFEGEQVFSGRDASPSDIIELLELGQLAENIFYKKAKTADLEDWENAIYG